MKKYLLVTALLLSLNAQADPIAWSNNKSGGKIILTSEKCWMPGFKNSDNAFKIVAYGKHTTTKGCYGIYKYDSSQIIVLWEDDEDTVVYAIDSFKPMIDDE